MRKRLLCWVVLAALAGCGGEAGRTGGGLSKGAALLAQGTSDLGLGVLPGAQGAFQEVVDEGLPEAPQAHLGLALARVLSVLDVVSFVADVALGSPKVPDAPALAPRGFPSPATDENEFILGAALSIAGPVLQDLEGAAADAEAARGDPSWSLEIPSLPVSFRRVVVADLGGTWDAADALALEALLKVLASGAETLLSQSLHADFVGAYEYAKPRIFVNGIDINTTAIFRVSTVLNFAAFLFNDPRSAPFLTPSSDDLDGNGTPDGREFMARAGRHLGEAAEDGVDAVARLRTERDGRAGHLFRVVTASRSGRTEEDLSIEAQIRRDGALAPRSITFPLRDAVGSGPDLVVAGLGAVASNLRSGGRRVTWGGDLAPVVLSLGLGILRSFDLSAAGLSVPSALSFLIQSNPPPLSAGVSLLTGVVPPALELDPAGFFTDPFSLRGLLPAWRNDLDPDSNNFLFEWECPGDVPAGARVGTTGAFPLDDAGEPSLLCRKGTTRVDAAHFASDPIFGSRGVAPIPADGLRSALPYFPFLDPTFHGLLYLDPGPLGLAGSGAAPATNLTLNAFLQIPAGLIRP